MTLSPDNKETLLTFPCDFTIKLFGYSHSAFESVAIGILQAEIGDNPHFRIQKRESKESKYLALSVTFLAESKAEIDHLYQLLSKNPEIIMVL